MNLDYNNKENRKKYLVISIKRDKRYITKNTILLVGSALLTAAGALGAYFWGIEVVKKWFGSESLNFQSKFLWELQRSSAMISLVATGRGIYSTTEKIRELTSDVRSLISNQNELAKLEEKPKGRSLG